VAPPVDPGPVVGRNNDYVVVSVRSGETVALRLRITLVYAQPITEDNHDG